MGQIVRCPLTGVPCSKPIAVQEKTFFLAETEQPQDDRERRIKAISEAIGDGYKIRSALEEKGINAFTCKICEMIQVCAYGMADITDSNPNVLFELGIMIALGKPTIILKRRDQEVGLKLPSDLNAIEIIPFTEYIDIIDQLRKVVQNLPPPVSISSPIKDLEKIQPQFAEELRRIGADVVKEFKESIEEAKLDTISLKEERIEVPQELSGRIGKLEEQLEDLVKLGFATDPKTAFLRGNYFYNQRKYNEALTSYSWSLELNPNHPSVLICRGLTYSNLKILDKALEDFNNCLEITPDNPLALASRSLTYIELERYDDALADTNRALELTPDDPLILIIRGIAYRELKRGDEALADANRALELTPDDPFAFNSRGATYAKLKRYDEALADFNRALELRPDKPSTLYDLACLFSLWGKTDDALAYLEKAISKDEKYREDAKTDEDFDNIRDDPRFKKLTESD